jgi:hypothetical protein
MKIQIGIRIGHKVVLESAMSLDGQEKQSLVVGTKFWTVHPNNRVLRFGNTATTPSNSNSAYARKKKVPVSYCSIRNEQQAHEKKETNQLRLNEDD